MKLSVVISIMMAQIATFEGYYKSKSLAARNNNPGNLRSWGKFPVVKGFVQFPTSADGFNALYTQIEKNINRKLTFLEFFAGKPKVYPGYAPASDNNYPKNYAAFVANPFKVPIETVIKDLVN